jgi:hypothetical protein
MHNIYVLVAYTGWYRLERENSFFGQYKQQPLDEAGDHEFQLESSLGSTTTLGNHQKLCPNPCIHRIFFFTTNRKYFGLNLDQSKIFN